MNQGTNFLIQQEVQKHKHALTDWRTRVCSHANLMDAAREAAHPPVPHQMVRSLRSLWQSEQSRARSGIEEHLIALLDEFDMARAPQAIRMLQGHWPRAAGALLKKMGNANR